MRSGHLLLGLALALIVAGCGGDKPPVGVTCTRNTDCQNPLSCTFGKCHETCREARDCPDGHRCIAVAGAGICQLEGKCAYLSECPVPLVCALDRQCRSECKEDKDCATPTQKCLKPDGVCAEPAEIDVSGTKLKSAQPTPVPAAPDGGVLDATVAGDSAPPATDGSPPATTEGGALQDVAAQMPDLAPDVNLGDVPVGPCGFPDPNEPANDKRETATLLAPGTPVLGCVAGKDPAADTDYFDLVAPDDAAGGYFQVAISEVGNDKIGMSVYAASDNTLILDFFGTPDLGASANAYFAAAPGQRYRVLVAYGWADYQYKTPFRYTIKATYTKINDTYEPNDTRAAARPITLGTPVMAYTYAGFTTGHLGFNNGRLGGPPTVDFYKVEAAAGTLKVTLENTASDVRMLVLILDPLGTERARGDSQTAGAGASAMLPVMTAGTYFIQVESFNPGPAAAAAGLNVAPSFTMPYTLTVSQ